MPNAVASNLNIKINGDMPNSVEKNIRSHLGKLPTSSIERSAFIYKAKPNVEEALQALGYYRARINTKVNKNLADDIWELTISVTPNQQTAIEQINITLLGEAQTDDAFKALLDKAPLKQGSSLHHGRYEQLKADILALGLSRGYFDGKFTHSIIAIQPDRVTANIDVVYQSGMRYQFGNINFSETILRQSLLDKFAPFNLNEPYDVTLLQDFQRQLEESQYFSEIIILPSHNKEGGETGDNRQVTVDVNLNPTNSHSFNFGTGYSTDTEFRQSVVWRTPLVNSYGHKQETKIEYSKINPLGRFTYTIPLSHPLHDVLQTQVSLENNDYGDIDSRHAIARLGRLKFYRDSTLEYYTRYLHETWQVNGIHDDANYFLFGATWSKTQRVGFLLDPSAGFSHYYNIEGTHKSIGSESSFIRFNAKWQYIFTLAPNHRLLTRAELGIAELSADSVENLAPSLRFFAGGDLSIRGFGYQEVGPIVKITEDDGTIREIVVGGTRKAIGSIEYQYYFNETWRGALFVDAGSVHTGDKAKLVYGVGPGIHYMSPVGAIRLNLGYNISEDDPSWRIHLAIGAEF